MKTLRFIFIIITAGICCAVQSQVLRTVTGRVVDRETRRAVMAASVTDGEGKYATVTNEDGSFILRMPSTSTTMIVSHIGYTTRYLSVGDGRDLRISMVPSTITLNEVLAANPEDVVRIAIENIDSNYVNKPVLQTGFYRETTRKGNRFIYIAEAITDMYRRPYTEGIRGDCVAIRKARRIISTSAKDTLGAKMEGGPTLPLTSDLMKNLDFLFDNETLASYNYAMGPARSEDGTGLVKVTLTPKPDRRRVLPYALLYGDLYITTHSLALLHADLSLDMTDKAKATRVMLSRKPMGVKFKPRGMEFSVTYGQDKTGRLTLSYIRSVMSFKCEWKRKLFSAPYVVTSEMVVTGEQTDGVKPIQSHASFNRHESLYDHPEYFGDPDFWSQYNIIAPTESLEKGIRNLKKRISQ